MSRRRSSSFNSGERDPKRFASSANGEGAFRPFTSYSVPLAFKSDSLTGLRFLPINAGEAAFISRPTLPFDGLDKLCKWLEDNGDDRDPSPLEMEQLRIISGLTRSQIETFISTARLNDYKSADAAMKTSWVDGTSLCASYVFPRFKPGHVWSPKNQASSSLVECDASSASAARPVHVPPSALLSAPADAATVLAPTPQPASASQLQPSPASLQITPTAINAPLGTVLPTYRAPSLTAEPPVSGLLPAAAPPAPASSYTQHLPRPTSIPTTQVPLLSLPPSVRKADKNRLLPKQATEKLGQWFSEHLTNPYPNKDEMSMLVLHSGLNDIQVANWFANARRRNKGLINMAEQVNSKLKAWFEAHLANPFPDALELESLCIATQLQPEQVVKWMQQARAINPELISRTDEQQRQTLTSGGARSLVSFSVPSHPLSTAPTSVGAFGAASGATVTAPAAAESPRFGGLQGSDPPPVPDVEKQEAP
eukprot:TRINITY_DN15695_c0_g1_i1.p1 TRINITY_DN15695_c0_g1~~TRINITY_DN15695_c0_g1_i1.p1  ORF type:complete len:481 (+),score=51.50 TRINITY_DN15695_c0_g1_i1:74-1516(+)